MLELLSYESFRLGMARVAIPARADGNKLPRVCERTRAVEVNSGRRGSMGCKRDNYQ